MGVTPSLPGQLRTTAMAPKVKLTYFNLRGRAEPSRLLLAYGGIKFEDCRLTPAFEDPKEWSELKPKTPYGSLPLLEWDGTCIASPWLLPGSSPGRSVWPAAATWSALRSMRSST